MKLFITGGCGYVGSYLIPWLLDKNYEIVVMDLQWFGNTLPEHDNLQIVKEDIRNEAAVRHYMQGCDTVIHLACISNDVSLELNPALGKSINLDCFPMLVQAAKDAGISRFIYASSSSVYGVKAEDKVTEDLSLEPMTDYALFKADCEPILLKEASDTFCVTVVRPGAVCGYAPRLRLDLVVNMLAAQAYFNRKITVFGGEQLRSHIHVNDIAKAYVHLLEADSSNINGQIFNVSHENVSVNDVALAVQQIAKEHLDMDVEIEVQPTDDKRSYHIDSSKIKTAIGFEATASYKHAIRHLFEKFGGISDPFSSQYINIKRMQELEVV